MNNTQGKLENIVKELKHVRDLARTGLVPMSFGNMTQAQWDEYRINKLSYELTELIYDLVNNMPEEEVETYYRTIYTVEVLSDHPVAQLTLAEIAYEIVSGDCSGDYKVSEMRVTKEHMRLLLISQGSDPEFLLGENEEE